MFSVISYGLEYVEYLGNDVFVVGGLTVIDDAHASHPFDFNMHLLTKNFLMSACVAGASSELPRVLKRTKD